MSGRGIFLGEGEGGGQEILCDGSSCGAGDPRAAEKAALLARMATLQHGDWRDEARANGHSRRDAARRSCCSRKVTATAAMASLSPARGVAV